MWGHRLTRRAGRSDAGRAALCATTRHIGELGKAREESGSPGEGTGPDQGQSAGSLLETEGAPAPGTCS